MILSVSIIQDSQTSLLIVMFCYINELDSFIFTVAVFTFYLTLLLELKLFLILLIFCCIQSLKMLRVEQ